jgi:glycosyltransferase involved in cell wall biosynthesis
MDRFLNREAAREIGQGDRIGSPGISVVVPVLNEEGNLDLLHAEIAATLDSLAETAEILYIDDGSTDRTPKLLRAIRDRDPRVRVIRFRRNFGQTAAMQAGFDHARGEIVVTMDGDLQNDPKDIPRLLDGIREGCDFVVGWRKNRKDKLLTRKLPSFCANRLIGWITGIRIHDNGCSLKAYRGEIVKRTQLYGDMHRFIPAMMSLSACRYREIVVNHRPRRFGRSKYGLSRTLRVASDLMLVKMLMSFTTRPALWFGLLSLPFLLLGTLFLVLSAYDYATLLREAAHSIVFPTAALLFTFAFVHLVLIGMVAELVVWAGDYQELEMIVPKVETEEAAT